MGGYLVEERREDGGFACTCGERDADASVASAEGGVACVETRLLVRTQDELRATAQSSTFHGGRSHKGHPTSVVVE